MKYAVIMGNEVITILPDEDPAFPGISITDRYSPDFLAGAIPLVEEDDSIQPGMKYNPETGEFSWPEPSMPGPVPVPGGDVEALRAAKLADLSSAGNAAIVAGVSVTLPSTSETEHFALHETDQINLTTALTAVEMGAAGYPYHADGQLCRLYPAQDILAISQAAIAHKLYHTTYCNHLLVWARRAETVEELAGTTYGAELPPDLADNLAAVLAAAGGAM